MTPRTLIRTFVGGAAIALTAACSPSDVTSPTPTASAPGDRTPAPVDGRAFVWTRETGAREIPVPAHATSMTVTDINDAGQVVGHVAMLSDEDTRAFMWSAADGYRPLGSLIGPDGISLALALNDSGTVSGLSFGPSSTMSGPMGLFLGDAFVWNARSGMKAVGGIRGLMWIARINTAGTIIGQSLDGTFTWNAATGAHPLSLAPGTDCSRPVDINDQGQILGYAGGIKDGFCRFSSVMIWNQDGSWTKIEDCAGHQADQDPCAISVVAMNNQGEVIGQRGAQGFKWSAKSGFTDFPAFAVTLAGINDRGEVVGSVFQAQISTPFVWSPSGELTMIPLPSGARSGKGVAINSAGDVVGTFQ
jgi:hypothetical protein